MILPGTKEWRDAAEGDLIDLVRRNDAQNFTLTLRCQDGLWRVEVIDLDAEQTDPPSNRTLGEGASFADAWHGQSPTWA